MSMNVLMRVILRTSVGLSESRVRARGGMPSRRHSFGQLRQKRGAAIRVSTNRRRGGACVSASVRDRVRLIKG